METEYNPKLKLCDCGRCSHSNFIEKAYFCDGIRFIGNLYECRGNNGSSPCIVLNVKRCTDYNEQLGKFNGKIIKPKIM